MSNPGKSPQARSEPLPSSKITGVWQQVVGHVAVGSMATAAHYALMGVLITGFGVSPTLATALGALLGSVIGYKLNHAFTYRSTAPHRFALPRHYAVVVAGMALNAAVFETLHGRLHAPVWAAQAAATGVWLLVGFVVMRGWVFRGPVR